VSYAANLASGESYVHLSNNGSSGAPLLGPGFGGAVGKSVSMPMRFHRMSN
jgi:hypothetical protein